MAIGIGTQEIMSAMMDQQKLKDARAHLAATREVSAMLERHELMARLDDIIKMMEPHKPWNA